MKRFDCSLLLPFLLVIWASTSFGLQYENRYTDDWQRIESENFVLVGDASERSMRRIGEQLERFRQVALAVIPASYARAADETIVVVFREGSAFRHFSPDGNVAAYFTAGPYKNYIAVIDDEEAQWILYHEYVHRLTRDSPNWPPWMREGMAEFYSTLEVSRDGKEVRIGHGIIPHLVWLSRTMMPLAEFLDPDTHFADSDLRQQTLYAQGWAFLHYLTVGQPEMGAELTQFLSLLESGGSVEASVETAFGIGLETLNDDFVRYVRGAAPFQIVDEVLPEPPGAAVLSAAEAVTEPEASTYLGDLLLHIGRYDEASSYFDHAVDVAGEFEPALTSLHLLHDRLGNEPLARRFLARAVRAPGAGYLPRLLTARRNLLDGPFAAVREEAEAHLRFVVGERGDLAEGHFWLGQLLMLKDGGIAEALDALEAALELDPLDPRIRLTYAEALWLSGDDEAALEMTGELIDTAGDRLVVDQAQELEDEIRAVTAVRRTVGPR